MKYTNTIVSVILAAAVLTAAYAIGLLIRETRTRGQIVPMPPEAAAMDRQRPGGGRAQSPEPPLTPEQKEQKLEEMRNLTPEQQQQFRDEVRRRVTPSDRGRGRGVTADEREKMMRKWRDMSEEQRKAYEAEVKLKTQATQDKPVSPDTVPSDGAKVVPDGREPNGIGQSRTSNNNQ